MVSVIRRTLLALLLVAATTTAVVAAGSVEAGASSTTYYAAVGGSGDCSVGSPCSLTTALSDVAPGDVVDLTTPGNASDSSTFYSGGFSVDTLSTSALEPVTIQPALGVEDPILDGGGSQTVLSVGSGVYFNISGVTIQDGSGNDGGGIANASGGTVTVSDSTFSSDVATYGGGAIDNAHSSSGAVTVTDSTFSGDSAGDDGGAIDNGDISGSGTVTVSDSTFSGNSATFGGGAVDNADNDGAGTVTVSDSTFSGNSAGDGGAIDNGDGGGNGTLSVTSSTFSGNTAGFDGPTIDEGDNAGSGATTVAGDLFAGSCDQASGSWTDNGDDVGSDTSCENGGPNDQVTSGLSSLLGPLADNGGPTQTMVPLGGNPAVGLVANPTANLCPTTDQRGVASGPGSTCDAGAVQLNSQSVTFTSSAPNGAEVGGTYTPTATGGGSGNPVNFSIDGSSTSGCTYDSGTGVVTFSAPAGTCVIDANQAGDDLYQKADQVQQTVTVGVLPQTITFTSSAPSGAMVSASYTPTASGGGSGNPVNFSIDGSSTSGCTYDSGTGVVTFSAPAGTCVIDANQAGNSTYGAAPQATQPVDVGVLAQTISFTSSAPSGAEVGGTYTPAATGGGSGDPVNFSIDGSSTSGCTYDSGTGMVTFSAPAGTCVIDANQAGNSTYGAAPQVNQPVDVGVLPQTISFTSSAPTGAMVGGTYTPTASGGGSGNPVNFSIDGSSTSGCTYDSGTGVVTFSAPAGTCVIDVNQAGNSTYGAASQVSQSLTVSLNSQAITFTSSAGSPVVGGTYTPSATGGGSGDPVNFSIDGSSTAGCTYDVGTGMVTFSAPAGTCVVDANQAGNSTYAPAPEVTQSVTVSLDSQTVSFTSSAPTGATVDGTYTPTAHATSTLTVTITVAPSSASLCSLSEHTVTFDAAGTCVLDANQAGDSTYAPAPEVTQSVTVSLNSQTITFTSSAPGGAEVGGTYTPAATGGGSGDTVNFSIDGSSTSGCTYDVGTGVVTLSAPAGACVIDANQAGDGAYQAAGQVQQTVTVGLLPQAITFTSSAGSPVVGGTYTPAATGGGSGNPVNFSIDGSSTSGCTYDVGTGVVTLSAPAGACIIDANQAGDDGLSYAAAPQTQQTVDVGVLPQTTSFTSSAPTGATVGGTYSPTAQATSNLTVAVTVADSSASVCSLSEGTVTFNGAGTCVIDANQSGNSTYAPASQVTQSVTVSLNIQTITFTSSAPTGAKVGGTYIPGATGGGSGIPVNFSIDGSSTSGCTYDVGTGVVTFSAPAGTCVIDANQAGNSTYAPASQVTQSVTVSLNSQTITFTSSAPGGAEVGGTYSPVATGGGSGNPVTFSIDGSSTSGCTYDTDTDVVTLSAPAGTCVIDANQAGDDAYQAAGEVQQSVDVGVLPQTVSFTSSAPTGAAVDGIYTPTAHATSNLSVAITVAASSDSVCSFSGAAVTFNGAGTCVIDADQAGNSTYAPASQVTQSVTVSLNSQTITFTSSAPGGAEVGGTYIPAATGGGSENPVDFSIDGSSTSGCTYDTDTGVVTFSAPAGTCVIDANQAGDDAYQAAGEVQQTAGVGVLPQTVSFTSSVPTGATVGGTYTPTAHATSNLTVAFTVAASSDSVCSFSGAAVTFNGAGTCVIDANQAGNSTYAPASQVTQSVTVSLNSQTITFTSSAPTGAVVGGTYTPTAYATSKLTVTITVASSSASVCSLSGHTVTFKAVGACVLDANQAGDATTAPAHQVGQSVTVGKTPHGYWLVGSDGGIFSFGTAHFYGSMGATPLNRPVVGITPTADDRGYWLVGSDGGVFAFGDAGFVGSLPGLGLSPAGSGKPRALSAPIVSIVPAVGDHGYFMVGSDGGIFALGDATFAGSCLTLAHGCDAPAVAVVPDASGRGYWLVTTVGSVYAFGNARALGGLGGSDPSPVTAMARSATGNGYLILQADGSVTSFGDAPHFGTMPVGYAEWLHDPAAAVVPTASGGGFWVMKADGAVFGYGDATYLGGMNNDHLNGAIIAAAGW